MFTQELLWYLSIFGWQDVVEILFFTGALFYLSLWLKQDTNQSLLTVFYGYCGAFLAAYHLELFTVSAALITFAPITVAICLILHQSTLQKNFIALHNITATTTTGDWLELIIRSSLVALGENKALTGVIEKKQALDTLITSSHPFDCSVSEGLFHVLLQSSAFNTQQMIWIDNNGKLRAINATWKRSSVDEWLAQEVKEQEKWLQDALFFTSKTDALFFKLHPTTRTFTLVAQGKILQQVSAHAALRTIKKYLGLAILEKGDDYAHISKTASTEQSLS